MQPTTIGTVAKIMDEAFPLATQDSWDNSGLIIGDSQSPLRGILLTVDITEATIAEAAERGCNMVISHHPILFKGLRRINYRTDEERAIALAIKNDIAIYAAHTCADKSPRGTSARLAAMIGITHTSVLVPDTKKLYKIAVYVPRDHADAIRQALGTAGAGHIGNYSHCTFSTDGHGTFKALSGANPYVGAVGATHTEPETRIETIVSHDLLHTAIAQMLAAHPYEEPAYDIYPLENQHTTCGYGVVGNLPQSLTPEAFMQKLKETFGCATIRHNAYSGQISRVAICTGSGSEFISHAMRAGAQAYITADIKYHQFAQPEGAMLITDIGHYESEELTKQLFLEILTEKLSNFAPCLSNTCCNTIKYY